MAVVNRKATFSCDIKKVWDVVTCLEDASWRSDLSRIEVLEAGKKFVEYTTDGYATTFTVTAVEPYKRWEFDMENDNIAGHWIGLFSGDAEKTDIDFTEEVNAKKMIMKPFVGKYLKKQQAAYVKDLKKALEEN